MFADKTSNTKSSTIDRSVFEVIAADFLAHSSIISKPAKPYEGARDLIMPVYRSEWLKLPVNSYFQTAYAYTGLVKALSELIQIPIRFIFAGDVPTATSLANLVTLGRSAYPWI